MEGKTIEAPLILAEKEIDSLFTNLFQNPVGAKSQILSAIHRTNGILPDTILAKYYSVLGVSFGVLGHTDSAVYAFNQALKLRLMLSSFTAGVKKNLGTVYRNSGSIEKAFDYYYVALREAIALKNDQLIATLYGEISSTYSLLNKMDLAIDYLQKAINQYEKIVKPDSIALAIFYQKLANVYSRQKDWKSALFYYEFVLAKVKNTKRADVYLQSILNLSGNYISQNKAEKALGLLDEAQKGIEQGQFYSMNASLYSRYAQAYYQLGEQDSLDYYFQKMMANIDLRNANHFGILLVYMELLRVREDFPSLAKVLDLVDPAPELLNTFFDLDKVVYYKIKSILFAHQKQHEAAYHALKMSLSITDSLNSSQSHLALHGLARKSELEKQLQEAIILKQRNQLDNRRLLLFLFASFSILLGSAYFIKTQNYRQRILALENQRLEQLHKQDVERIQKQKKEFIEASNENLILKEQLQKVIKKHGKEIEFDLSNWSADSQIIQSVIKRSEILEDSWLANLKIAAPTLSRSDLEFCLLIHLGLSFKDIAQLLNISHSSVHTKKYRLAKKIGLPAGFDLYLWLSEIVNSSKTGG